MLESRQSWSVAAPLPRSRMDDWPTVLFSWWCTSFSAVIILTRLSGRKIRSNVLFREDWIMFASLVPLFIRMALVHVVLIYGTNNVQTAGYTFTEQQLDHRSVGSRLVLAARIFYAMFIWANKLTVSEFLKRITIRIWRKSYEMTLQGIRIFLVVTFFAVVIATLVECKPFSHYWQVVPDPGPQCRTGYAQLLTMGTCDIVTDILLVAFPIPIVLNSGQSWKRKLQLASLFSLSVIMIGVTATRMPQVISHLGQQQYRTVWASCEILASTAVSNGVILGSFLRDKGTKKNKFRSQSVTDSIDRAPSRRPTVVTLQENGSDEDLFRFLGCRMPEHLRYEPDVAPRPAPIAEPAKRTRDMEMVETHHAGPTSSDSEDSLREAALAQRPLASPIVSTKRSVSFFDVGGLLEDGSHSPGSRSRTTLVADSGTIAQDFATPTPDQSRRGSNAFFSDAGGLLPTTSRSSNGATTPRRHSDVQNTTRYPPIGVLAPMLERQETPESLQDTGGLLPEQEISEREHTARLIAALRRGPPSSAVSTSAQLPRPGTQQSLQDVGGLLSADGQLDDSAATLRGERGRRSPRIHEHMARAGPRRRGGPVDGMDLHDPGGLLS